MNPGNGPVVIVSLNQEIPAGVLGIVFALVGFISIGFPFLNHSISSTGSSQRRVVVTKEYGISRFQNDYEITSGDYMRRIFFVCIGISCCTRAFCLISQALLYNNEGDDDSGDYNIQYTLYLILPDVFFTTSYSVIATYVLISYLAIVSTPMVSTGFSIIAVNTVFYISIAIVLILCSYGELVWSYLYATIAVFLLTCGIILGYFASKLFEKVNATTVVGRKINGRLFPLVCLCCSASICLSVSYLLLSLQNYLMYDDIYFGYLYIISTLLELVPSIGYLFLMFHKSKLNEEENSVLLTSNIEIDYYGKWTQSSSQGNNKPSSFSNTLVANTSNQSLSAGNSFSAGSSPGSSFQKIYGSRTPPKSAMDE